MVLAGTHTAQSSSSVPAMIAGILLTREVGQRIPTLQELQQVTRSGSGTVLKALRDLEAGGAIGLSSHGHQGTLVKRRDVGRLWAEAGRGSFLVAMPPPGPLEQQGIIESIQGSLNRIGVAVLVRAMAGAPRRLEELYHERVHAAVVSGGAYEESRARFPGLTAIDLGEGSFYSAGSLVVVAKPGAATGPRIRVGIDRSSYDHQLLTKAEFDDDSPEYVDTRFVLAPAAVLKGEIDAAVWHQMPTVIPPALAGLEIRPLRPETIEGVKAATRAVLVTRGLDAGVNAVARHVDPGDIARTQARLLAQTETDGIGEMTFWPR